MRAASASCSSSISRTARPWISAPSSSAERRAFVSPKRGPLVERSIRLFAFRLLFHPVNQTLRPHVLPILIDEFKAGRAGAGLKRNGPAGRHLFESGPKGMLPLFIDQDVIDALFVFERIGHRF